MHATHSLPLATLLIKQLRRLRHSHSNELVLAAFSIALAPARKHLQRLHGGRSADILAARLLLLVSLATPVQLLMLLHRVLLVHVFLLQLGLLAGQQTERGAEERRVGRFAGVGGRVLRRRGVVLGDAAVGCTAAVGGAGGVLARGVMASLLWLLRDSIFAASSAAVSPTGSAVASSFPSSSSALVVEVVGGHVDGGLFEVFGSVVLYVTVG